MANQIDEICGCDQTTGGTGRQRDKEMTGQGFTSTFTSSIKLPPGGSSSRMPVAVT